MNCWIPTKGLFVDLCLHEKNQPGPVYIPAVELLDDAKRRTPQSIAWIKIPAFGNAWQARENTLPLWVIDIAFFNVNAVMCACINECLYAAKIWGCGLLALGWYVGIGIRKILGLPQQKALGVFFVREVGCLRFYRTAREGLSFNFS